MYSFSTELDGNIDDPAAVLALVNQEGIEALAADVRGRLLRVREAIGGRFID